MINFFEGFKNDINMTIKKLLNSKYIFINFSILFFDIILCIFIPLIKKYLYINRYKYVSPSKGNFWLLQEKALVPWKWVYTLYSM